MDYTALSIKRDITVYKNMRDPALLKYFYKFKTVSLLKDNELFGSSPPDIFVGRIGYPNVFMGPLVPPQLGDTSIMSTPERWVGKSIPDIVEYRSMLVRGMYKTKITNVNSGRIEDMLQELALSEKSTNIDAQLKRGPTLKMAFNDNSQPFGPSAPMVGMEMGNTYADRKLENAYFDTSMRAVDAMEELYTKGTLVSKIQKALSAGLLGVGKNRKFVPTRWSITAVDDTLSKRRLETVKQCQPIDSVRVYENVALDNRWIIIMVPGAWSYESMEAWYPGTTWNMDSDSIAIMGSYELNKGRRDYAEIGGCYYAARLAVSELLEREQRQAQVVILREAHPGYIMPVGVWNVREHVRETLRNDPKHFATLRDALGYASTKLDIPINAWIKNGRLLRMLLSQRRIGDYLAQAI